MSFLQKEGTLRQDVQIIEEKQLIERKSSSAAEDNWDHNKIQKINGSVQRVFYITTLFLNERPIKLILNSGSPVKLISNCLFTKTTEVEPLITT